MDVGYVTNGTTQDGFGARMQRAVNTMVLTFYLRDKFNVNLEYIHTPFAFEGFGERFDREEVARAIGDNLKPYNEISREGYLKRAVLWDNCMCYSGMTINDINLTGIEIINSLDFNKNRLLSDVSNKRVNNKLYFIKYLSREFNSGQFDVNMVDTYYSQIRERFQFPALNNNEVIIHIRRKDAINFGEVRYVEDGYYLSILNALIPFKEKYNITIHTQRKGFDSSKYGDWHIIYDDEEEDYNLFIKMVSAKVLIAGKSSFSIVAGFLNQNIVVYPPQPTKGLSRFINKKQFIKSLNT